MIAISLQSGSNGNCIYVEASGVRLLFDAGICGALAESRLARHGRNIRDVDAVIISHDHGDHVRYAGVFHRKFGLPVFMSPGTHSCAVMRHRLGAMKEVCDFLPGDVIEFDGLAVETVPTNHDGEDGAAFVISSEGLRLGILTDLGHVCERLVSTVSTLDAVIIESNYDPDMLSHSSYPAFLKNRIRGPRGHLSNAESAELLRVAGSRLRWACLAHLSAENNYPALALETHRSIVGDYLPIHIASRYEESDVMEVGE